MRQLALKLRRVARHQNDFPSVGGPFDDGQLLLVPVPDAEVLTVENGLKRTPIHVFFVSAEIQRALLPEISIPFTMLKELGIECHLDVHNPERFNTNLDWRVANTLNGHCAHIRHGASADELRLGDLWRDHAARSELDAAAARDAARMDRAAAVAADAEVALQVAVDAERPSKRRRLS